MSSFLDQKKPSSKVKSKNELICIRYFEVVQKTRSRVLSGLNLTFLNLIIHSGF